jgi:hypothetical protein
MLTPLYECCAAAYSLELNYAQQNEDVDMIPLMMEFNYKPKARCTELQQQRDEAFLSHP